MDQTADAVEDGFRDRRTGLIIFGIVGILFGAFKLISFTTLLGFSLFAGNLGIGPQAALNARIAPFSMGYQLGLAVLWIWLGIGSIKTRRWARALILMYSWFWLISGTLGLVFSFFYLPSIMERMPDRQAVNPAIMSGVMAFTWIVMAFFAIVVPLIFVLFYGSRHVKATCERRDPQPAWTDRCPLPVLAASLFLGFGGVMIPLTSLMFGVILVFGIFLEGFPAFVVVAGSTALWFWQAWGIYRLRLGVWRITLASMILFGLSGFVTFAKIDLLDLYSRMGLSGQELELLRQSGIFDGLWLTTLMGASTVLWLGYLLFIRRYFGHPATL